MQIIRTNIRMIRTLALILAITFWGFSDALAEGNINSGTKKARACQVCHGKGGHSTNASYPILAGQHAAYIQKQLRAFRAGTRKDPIMNSMASTLSDQDIDDIAVFFQSKR